MCNFLAARGTNDHRVEGTYDHDGLEDGLPENPILIVIYCGPGMLKRPGEKKGVGGGSKQ